MGVPGLFGYCLKKFGNFIITKSITSKIHYLFIDGNGFIYNAVENIIKRTCTKDIGKYDLYHMIYEKTLELLEEVIKLINPEIVYLTFDGVAPMAKINQQRSRRYKTKYEDDFKSYLNLKYGKKENELNHIWSNVLITPGTEFMNNLDLYFNKKFEEINKSTDIKFLYNGSNVHGEGEHKILNYIRENKELKNKDIVIHGLDGDLIFLLMLTDIKEKKNNNIYILRETKTKHSTIKSFLNVNDLRKLFIDELTENIKINKPEFNFSLNNLVDLIFIFFFIGNDFLPCQRFLNIYDNGVDLLLKNYISTISKYESITIVNNSDINYNILAFYYFIQLCTITENEEFQKIKESRNRDIYFKIEKLKRVFNNMTDEYEKELFRFENNNLSITKH